jgi:hypothetical protein
MSNVCNAMIKVRARSVRGQTTIGADSLMSIASWPLDPKQFGLRGMSNKMTRRGLAFLH